LTETTIRKPFLKWAGNKFKLAERIKALLPEGKRLIEPFAGSGAVFLNTKYPRYLLTDTNKDLINLCKFVQKEGPSFFKYCQEFLVPENNDEARYYEFRKLFNATEDERLKSALFIYLNRYGYNGLCRYNLSGGFNVPFGRYKTVHDPKEEMLFFHQKAKKAVFKTADFVKTMESAKLGDVIYCDPPYAPLSETANFTGYSAGGFSAEDQLELARQARACAKRGIPVVISNHDTEFVHQAYEGAKITSFPVQRLISCNKEKRGKAQEVLAVFS